MMKLSPVSPYGTNDGLSYPGRTAGLRAPSGEAAFPGQIPAENADISDPLKGLEPDGPDGRGKKEPGEECETCKERKYQDGSDEMVSFKTPTHLSPQNAAAAVRAHEQEHVSNAYAKASMKNGKVISAAVSIHTAICPECGRTYVSGGVTRTQIRYYNEDNPYQQGLKSADRARYSGLHLNYRL